jgi:hypothetical protein
MSAKIQIYADLQKMIRKALREHIRSGSTLMESARSAIPMKSGSLTCSVSSRQLKLARRCLYFSYQAMAANERKTSESISFNFTT